MSDFDFSFFENFDKHRVHEQDKPKVFKTVQLGDELTALYTNEDPETEEQEQQISMGPENPEDFPPKFRCESKTQAAKDKQEKINKILKTAVILILGFLLLNFVLVGVVIIRKHEIPRSSSSSSATGEFSAWVNQTHETGEILDDLKLELDGIKEWKNSTEEKFESQHAKIESLQNQTKIEEKFKALEKENGELKKSNTELTQQFESLSKKVDQLEKNISFISDLHSKSITSCSVAMEIFPSPRTKKLLIHPHGNRTSVEVLCDFEVDGGGWTIIQKRSSGPKEEFSQNWNEYANGFGSLDKNFWIGLENIHTLTKNEDQELRIEIEDFEGNKRWAKYSSFSISDASDFYRLDISGFSENSTAGDSMTNLLHTSAKIHHGMRFTTKDMDNDNHPGYNCAADRGGWWLNLCSASNLNGLYFDREDTAGVADGIRWDSWKGPYSSLAKTEMKIRTRKSP